MAASAMCPVPPRPLEGQRMRCGLLMATLCGVLATGCSTYREPPSADIVPGRIERGDRVRILTNDGERFHAVVDSVEGGWVVVRNKEYRYQDGARSEAQRTRVRYEMAALSHVLVAGPARPDWKAVAIVAAILSAAALAVKPAWTGGPY